MYIVLIKGLSYIVFSVILAVVTSRLLLPETTQKIMYEILIKRHCVHSVFVQNNFIRGLVRFFSNFFSEGGGIPLS